MSQGCAHSRLASSPPPTGEADLFLELFSYDSGIIGSVISDEYRQFHKHFAPNDPKGVGSNERGAIVALLAGGCFFGAFLAGWTANKVRALATSDCPLWFLTSCLLHYLPASPS